jgi:hypothetical protein
MVEIFSIWFLENLDPSLVSERNLPFQYHLKIQVVTGWLVEFLVGDGSLDYMLKENLLF